MLFLQSDFLSVGLDFKGARQNFLDTSTNMARMEETLADANDECKEKQTWLAEKIETVVSSRCGRPNTDN